MLIASLDSFVQLITAILIFAFVLVLTYFTTKFTAGYQKDKMKSANSEVVDAMRLSNNKTVQIIRSGNHYYSVVLCKDTVTLLGEISPEEINIPEAGQNMQVNFQDILEKAKKFRHEKEKH